MIPLDYRAQRREGGFRFVTTQIVDELSVHDCKYNLIYIEIRVDREIANEDFQAIILRIY